jgi:ABC-type uncharacterized transport system ATPase subunit
VPSLTSGPKVNIQPTVAFDHVTKRFGTVLANDSISCDVAASGIHAFLGENGAGKSTLMKVLSGCYKPDSGRVLLNGRPAVFRSPSDAQNAGVGMVYQHFTLVQSMTILDNIILGDLRLPLLLRRRSLRDRVHAELNHHGFNFDLSSPAWRLRPAERQKVEIFKLLWRDARVLILDEPTSQLAPFEAEDILTIMSNLAKDGKIVLMVSHNIEEVLRFSCRITVLRKGRSVATVDSQSAQVQELARLMVGELPSRTPRTAGLRSAGPVMSLRNITVHASSDKRALTDLSLDIYSGEVLGVAGVSGSGQDELVSILTGQLVPDRGLLLVNGNAHPWETLREVKTSVAHVPSDPRNDGSVQRLSLLDNLFLRDIKRSRFLWGPILRKAAMREEAAIRLDRLQVRPNDPGLPCSMLSGGNLQRLILARELGSEASVLVAVNPCAGLDPAAARTVREELQAHSRKGNAVILISQDLAELLNTSDRILVLCGGEIAGVEQSQTLDSESLGLLMGGVKAEIVRALMDTHIDGMGDGNAELRTAIHSLLYSPDWWQRRLAAQIALRLFVKDDLPSLLSRLAEEDHEEARVWMLLVLARIGDESHLEALINKFNEKPPAFVEAQRKLVRSEDYASMRSIVLHRLTNGAAPWECVLGLLVLRHLGETLDHRTTDALSASTSATIARLAEGHSAISQEGQG